MLARLPWPASADRTISPFSDQPLTIAPPELIAGRTDREGHPLEAALLRADGSVLYPIRNGIPVMLVEAAIPVRPAP